jgi:tetratricopeptide (TPR) repeat protein
MKMFQLNSRPMLALIAFTALLLSSVSALAQINATVRGKAIGSDGKPIPGATVQMVNKDNGRKFTMKTNKNGEFLNIGVAPGKYDCSLVGPDGKVLSTANNFPVDAGQESNNLEFNVQQEQKETQAIVSGEKKVEPQKLTEEQKKAIEAAQKQNEQIKQENAKIGNLNQMLTSARTDIQAKNYQNAVATMNQAIQVDPTQPLLYGTLGDASLGMKDYKGCIDAFTKAIDLQSQKKPNPQIASRWLSNLGSCQARNGDVAAAQSSFDKAAQEDPTFAAQAYFNEGAILTNAGKTDDANAAFDKAIAADPNKAEAYYQKGVNLTGKATTDKTGKVIPAPGTVQALQKYLELAPDGPNAQAAKDILTSFGEKVQTNLKVKSK